MADIRFKIAYASIVTSEASSIHERKADAIVQVGQMPWLDKFIAKNPLIVLIVGTHPIVKFTVGNMIELPRGHHTASKQRDFLPRSLEAQQKSPELVTDRIVRMWNIDNVFAGSDTTAISLRAVSEFDHRACRGGLSANKLI